MLPVNKAIKLKAFGKEVEVICSDNKWATYYCDNEGKKCNAHNINLHDNLSTMDIIEYLIDLFHAWAKPRQEHKKVP